ncbi:hypothetical protein P154DRAFT_582499 [Amniculicola lignicola CBS 123094]|uniref:Ankyrin n=1 Tax=Amniculicola lignicola CBS 123094 TaxID=1392246 RepID=A0A6A5W3K9_9PLEO|nr:hypothetical protein P154DRAFT_582499 [Amniculicola lignicola CBS 123094]
MANQLIRIDSPSEHTDVATIRDSYVADIINALVHCRSVDCIPWDGFLNIFEEDESIELCSAAAVGSNKAIKHFVQGRLIAQTEAGHWKRRGKLLLGSPIQAAAATGKLEVLICLLDQLLSLLKTDGILPHGLIVPGQSPKPFKLLLDSRPGTDTSSRTPTKGKSEEPWPWIVRDMLNLALGSAIRACQMEAVKILIAWRIANGCTLTQNDWRELLKFLIKVDSLTMMQDLISLFSQHSKGLMKMPTMHWLAEEACKRDSPKLLQCLLQSKAISLSDRNHDWHCKRSCTRCILLSTKLRDVVIRNGQSGATLMVLLEFGCHPAFTLSELAEPFGKHNCRMVQIMLDHGCPITSCMVSRANFGIVQALQAVQGGETLASKLFGANKMLTAYLVFKHFKNQSGGHGEEPPPRTTGLKQVEAYVQSTEHWKKITNDLLGGSI